ncbi:MAG: carboxypeptidase-like regulatory domain-containing protein, partial [Ignavibacteriaceae bacterium]
MKRWVTVLISFLLLPMLVLAGTTGKIKGKVTDKSNGEPLIGASVVVVGTSFGAMTDIDGNYSISNLSAGTYAVKATYIGYQPTTLSGVRVNA